MNVKSIVWLGLLAAVGFGCEASNTDGLADPTVEETAVEETAVEETTEALTREEPECTKDSDCRAEADYCTGCDCVALASDEQLAECPGPGVRCVMDPCVQHAAICQKNTCVIE